MSKQLNFEENHEEDEFESEEDDEDDDDGYLNLLRDKVNIENNQNNNGKKDLH